VAVWDSTTVPNGTYTLYSVNAQTPPTWSAGVTITVDNPKPAATITSPQDGATVSGTVLYQAVPSPSYVAKVFLGITGPSFPTGANLAVLTAPGPNGWAVEWNTTGVANGTYTLQASAGYPLGNNLSGAGPPITITVAN
jgi:hypothetical protein